MSRLLALTKRELEAYFFAPVPWVLTFFFLLLTWYFFQWEMSQTYVAVSYGPVFIALDFILMFLVPLLTMNSVAEERSRIARELHDAVTQNLFTVATIADAIPDLWDSHPQETRQALDNLRRLSRGALAEMRILLLELRPSALLEKTLGKLLQQLGEGVEGRSRIQVITSVIGDQVFDSEVQIAFYRIAQEALNNVIKHSEATRVTIGLYGEADALKLSITDNGIGFNAETGRGGFGLENMQERARQIQADFVIKSEIDNGTEVTVNWRPSNEENS